MIQTVVKRDGRVVGFNEEKIIAAIRRAMLHTAQGEDMELASTIADRVAYRGAEQMTVEEIQDNVEIELMKSRRKDVAQLYIAYRNGALHVKQKRETFFWKLSKQNPTTLPGKMRI